MNRLITNNHLQSPPRSSSSRPSPLPLHSSSFRSSHAILAKQQDDLPNIINHFALNLSNWSQTRYRISVFTQPSRRRYSTTQNSKSDQENSFLDKEEEEDDTKQTKQPEPKQQREDLFVTQVSATQQDLNYNNNSAD